MQSEKSLELSGGLPQTATWVKIDIHGDLIVDLYDFSEAAHDALGNDVAFVLTIKAAEKPRLLALLETAPGDTDEADPDDLLLRLLWERFASYYEVMAWLDAQQVPYTKSFDPWA